MLLDLMLLSPTFHHNNNVTMFVLHQMVLAPMIQLLLQQGITYRHSLWFIELHTEENLDVTTSQVVDLQYVTLNCHPM